jgi:phage anti-repressor protein
MEPIASIKLDIVDLIEKNPITRFHGDYKNKFIQKIQEKFTESQQHLFIGSFYCYLNYNKNDFVIDLENVWKWLGFSRKDHAKVVVTKHFIENIDYLIIQKPIENEKKIAAPEGSEAIKNRGGLNKETILFNINTFKKLCLKSNTKKADEIHNYFIKLEEIFHEVVNEESNELRLQLDQKETLIMNIKNSSEKEKEKLLKEKIKAVEKAIVVQFPVNTECIYVGTIENTNEANEKLIKFGQTNDLSTRMRDHHTQYTRFSLIRAFRVQNKVEIENLIKTHPKIKCQIRSIELNGKNKTEIIAYDNEKFTTNVLLKTIKEIIESKTYSIDNFNKILRENDELTQTNKMLEAKVTEQDAWIMKQTIELEGLHEKLENQKKSIDAIDERENKNVYQNVLLPEDEITKKFTEFVNSVCIVHPDAEEISVDLEGRYRLWSQVKPTKEIFHALKAYLDTRFRPKRIQLNHGYMGIKLKKAEYIKKDIYSNVETFIFQVCVFSDTGKILNSTLLFEYKNWKESVGREVRDDTTEMKEIKEYLNSSPYALKATLWIDQNSGEGYYGVSLKQQEVSKPKSIASTGKKIEKRLISNNDVSEVNGRNERETLVIGMWNSILAAALHEGVSAAKMSRLVKNKTVVGDYIYCCANS